MASTTAKRLSRLMLGSCLALGAGSIPIAGAEEIRIGFLAPTTGIFAQVGKDMVDGFQMYLDEVKGDFGDAKIKFIVEDEQGKPDTAVTKAKKLILQDKVQFFVGGLLASTGYALAPVSTSEKTVYISSVAAADDLTQRDLPKYPYFIRTGWTSSQPSHPFGQWACDQGYKKIVAIGADYAFGYEVVGGFQRSFEEAGGQIIQKLWAPLGTSDLAPYITQLKRDADAAFIIVVAASALRFPAQYRDAGLLGRLPVIGGAVIVDESILPSFGDEALGYVTPLMYSAALDTPANRKFVADYRKKYGKVPSYFSETCYTSARWINEAAKLVGGQVEEREKFMAAFRRVEIPDAPRGPVKLDQWGNPIQNIYVRRVERQGGELQNTVVHTFPAVSQFWTYKPEEFLKQPVYNRDYPPCKGC